MKRRSAGAIAGLALAVAAAGQPALKSGLDLGALDTSVRPQDDLFHFVNGRWLAATEIPADRVMYGTFLELQDRAERDLRDIIEETAARPNRRNGSTAQQIVGHPDRSGPRGRGRLPLDHRRGRAVRGDRRNGSERSQEADRPGLSRRHAAPRPRLLPETRPEVARDPGAVRGLPDYPLHADRPCRRASGQPRSSQDLEPLHAGAAAHGDAGLRLDGLGQAARHRSRGRRTWRAKVREDYLRQWLLATPHAPPQSRVNGPVSNISGFYDAFGVRPGDRLYRDPGKRVAIW